MSRAMPYNPMHSPRKRVSLEQMQLILQKHAGHKVEIKPLPSKPEAVKPPEIEWKKLTADSIQCPATGRVILRARSPSCLPPAPHDIYIVFSGSSHEGQTAQVLARFRSAQDAKDYCRLLPRNGA